MRTGEGRLVLERTVNSFNFAGRWVTVVATREAITSMDDRQGRAWPHSSKTVYKNRRWLDVARRPPLAKPWVQPCFSSVHQHPDPLLACLTPTAGPQGV